MLLQQSPQLVLAVCAQVREQQVQILDQNDQFAIFESGDQSTSQHTRDFFRSLIE